MQGLVPSWVKYGQCFVLWNKRNCKVNFHFKFLGRWDSFNGKIRRVTASPSLIPFLKTKLSSHRPTILNYNTLSAINRIYTYKRMRKILAELIDTKFIPFFLCKSKSDGDAKKFCFCFWSAEDSSKNESDHLI